MKNEALDAFQQIERDIAERIIAALFDAGKP